MPTSGGSPEVYLTAPILRRAHFGDNPLCHRERARGNCEAINTHYSRLWRKREEASPVGHSPEVALHILGQQEGTSARCDSRVVVELQCPDFGPYISIGWLEL
jgi:hypothetical protein